MARVTIVVYTIGQLHWRMLYHRHRKRVGGGGGRLPPPPQLYPLFT